MTYVFGTAGGAIAAASRGPRALAPNMPKSGNRCRGPSACDNSLTRRLNLIGGLAVAYLAVMACEVGAQEGAAKPSGRVTAYGMFAVAEHKTGETGGEGGVSSLKLLKKSERIPAKVGTSFGFCYEISGFPAEGEVTLSETAVHPAMKRPDGDVRYSFTLPRTVRVSEGVGRSCSGYSFEQPYEVRRGRWRFSLSHEAQTLVVQEFVVE